MEIKTNLNLLLKPYINHPSKTRQEVEKSINLIERWPKNKPIISKDFSSRINNAAESNKSSSQFNNKENIEPNNECSFNTKRTKSNNNNYSNYNNNYTNKCQVNNKNSYNNKSNNRHYENDDDIFDMIDLSNDFSEGTYSKSNSELNKSNNNNTNRYNSTSFNNNQNNNTQNKHNRNKFNFSTDTACDNTGSVYEPNNYINKYNSNHKVNYNNYSFDRNMNFDDFNNEDFSYDKKESYMNKPLNNPFNVSEQNKNVDNKTKTSEFLEYENTNHKLADLREWGRPFEWDEEINDINLRYFGHKQFRRNQREIINASLAGRDIFVCIPTGGGKSLTFQIPAIKCYGVTLVVMPLISLINDQVSFLRGVGVCVQSLSNESCSGKYEEWFHPLNDEEMVKILFLTPEK